MKTITQHFGTSQKIIVLAIVGAFGSAHAADDDMAQFTKPESSVTVGATAVSGNDKDRSIFGQYNGMRDHSGTLQLDIDYLKRNDATGTWMSLQGRNLGLDNRELGVAMQKQGDWKVTGEYNELVRHDIRTINTANTGVGSDTPSVVRLAVPGTGSDVDLKLKRVGLGLGVEKWFTPSFQFEASFKNEDKDGARFWGRGYDCASYVCGTSLGSGGAAIDTTINAKNAILMMAEPVNTNTKQFEMKFNFNDEKLNLSAGYYGSFFTNSIGSLNPSVPNVLNGGRGGASTLYPAVTGAIIAGGGMSLQNVLQSAMALPPDNQAHQFSLAGNYAFTPTTKGTFKYAYTHATQDKDFISSGFSGAPAGRANLGGVVDNTLVQFGLTMKPLPKLSLLANVRYERKEDKTPLDRYNTEARAIYPAADPQVYSNGTQLTGVAPATWDNNHVTSTKLASKFEGSYLFPENIRATFGLDYNSITRAVPGSWDEEVVAALGGLREKNEERGFRLELRRAMTENFTGAVGYSQSKREGSNWTTLSTLDPTLQTAIIGNGYYTSATNSATQAAAAVAAATTNLALINLYCGGRTCYGQQLPASSILALSNTTAFPMSMVDLERTKWKLSANWTPMDKLSLQFGAEDGNDVNKTAYDPLAGQKGYKGTKVSSYNVDADYVVSDSWKVNAYWSFSSQNVNMGHSTGYQLALNDENGAFGFGVLGKATGRLEVGANLTYLTDVNKYNLAASPSAVGAAPTAANAKQAALGLPDVSFRQYTLSLFGKYALDKSADIRVNLVYQSSALKEWAWENNGTPFVYGDNTTVSIKSRQNVMAIGGAYIYKFQ